MRLSSALAAAAAMLVSPPAWAVDIQFDGFTDFRLVAPAGERAWLEGGLGKLRYGDGDSNFQFGGAYAQGTVLFTPEVVAVAVARADPTQKEFVLPMESYLRYRPVSTTPLRWAVKMGAFFPPFSLENTEIGWTSYWTLTPSAIDSWFGDELRTIGGEGTLEWREEQGTFALTGALFGCNDPAGVMIADRGWTMDDRPTALFDTLREPDATLELFHQPIPDTTPIFDEIDHRVGWYAGARWNDIGGWLLEIFRYDNDADPSAHDGDYFAWHTSFWDGGVSRTFGEFSFLAQGLTGTTIIAPAPGVSHATDFDAAYGLIGWQRGDWRLAARADVFHTHAGTNGLFSENGYATTVAATWLPKDWVRITAEILFLDSTRNERLVEALAPNESDVQAQLSFRFYL